MGICTCQNSANVYLKLAFHCVCFSFLSKKQKLNKYWAPVNDLYAEMFMGKNTDICILLWNSWKKNKMVNGIDECYQASLVKC